MKHAKVRVINENKVEIRLSKALKKTLLWMNAVIVLPAALVIADALTKGRWEFGHLLILILIGPMALATLVIDAYLLKRRFR